MAQVIAFLVTIAAAVVLMWCARQALTPRWAVWVKIVPRSLVHRWTLGTMAIGGLVLFFSVPFFLVGAYAVGVAGLLVVTLVTATFGRDILVWIIDDLKEHWRERRSLFRHSASCIVHQHYHG